MDGQQEPASKTIVVTGFDVFRDYQHNASWEAVARLPATVGDGYVIKREKVEVSYAAVQKIVPSIWQSQQSPLLVVHCGVSRLARGLVLEQCAYTAGYCSKDVCGLTPSDPAEMSTSPDCCQPLQTKLGLEAVAQKINDAFSSGRIKLPAELSTKAGRYLCEYIYCHSLRHGDPERTVFIHVPELELFSADQTAEALLFTIEALIECLKSS